jgi:hypothetical protein
VSAQVTFNSVQDLLDWIDVTPPLSNMLQSNSSIAVSYRQTEFSGAESMAQARELVEGWQEGISLVEAFSRPVVDMITSKVERNDIYHDVEGMGIDIAAYVEGEPECWQAYQATHVEGTGRRVLRLVVNAAVSGGINKSKITERGAFIASTVDCLERAGFSVEVWYCIGIRNHENKKNVDFNTLLKPSNQPIDMARFAFVLAHPAMFRRIMFAAIERHPDLFTLANFGSYGRPAPAAMEATADIAFGEHMLGDTFPVSRLLKILSDAGVVLTQPMEVL